MPPCARLRGGLFQELQALADELESKSRKAGDIAAGMREARGKAGRDRIRAECRTDNWDRARGFVYDHCGFLGVCDDNVDRQPHQFASHRLQSAGIPGSEPVLDLDVLAVNIAEVAQAFAKCVEYLGRGPFGRR